jgi:hypothetical protein
MAGRDDRRLGAPSMLIPTGSAMPATPTTITPYADPRLDTLENYLGTDPSVMCSPDGDPDNDSFDNNQDTFADVGDIATYGINGVLNEACPYGL